MDARYYIKFKKFLKSGDRAVVYTHGGKFVAVIEFVGDYFYDEKHRGWTKGGKLYLFPYRIKFRILYESREGPPKIEFSTVEEDNRALHSNPNLIDDITFIADKGKTWNQYLQVSIIRITEEDFDTISEAIKKRS